MLQVASEPTIHAQSHNLPRHPRSAQADRAPSRVCSMTARTTVVVDGATAQLTGGSAGWNLNVSKPSTATITIKDSIGQNVYTSTIAVNPGTQTFTWNGRGNDGRLWPDGRYTLTSTAVDANKQFLAISTKVQAIVDSVDLAQDPPQLSINGQNYTLDKIKRIVRPTT